MTGCKKKLAEVKQELNIFEFIKNMYQRTTGKEL